MNSILNSLKNLKNLFPYFLLIAIYFFFVNLEARKESDKNLNADSESIPLDGKSNYGEDNLRIKIPVIPYSY